MHFLLQELYAAVLTAIDMMFAYHIVTQFGLDVKLWMILYVDNKGVVDLSNNWSVGRRTRHIGVKHTYLKELKETGYLQILHKPGKDLVTNSGTKMLVLLNSDNRQTCSWANFTNIKITNELQNQCTLIHTDTQLYK